MNKESQFDKLVAQPQKDHIWSECEQESIICYLEKHHMLIKEVSQFDKLVAQKVNKKTSHVIYKSITCSWEKHHMFIRKHHNMKKEQEQSKSITIVWTTHHSCRNKASQVIFWKQLYEHITRPSSSTQPSSIQLYKQKSITCNK